MQKRARQLENKRRARSVEDDGRACRARAHGSGTLHGGDCSDGSAFLGIFGLTEKGEDGGTGGALGKGTGNEERRAGPLMRRRCQPTQRQGPRWQPHRTGLAGVPRLGLLWGSMRPAPVCMEPIPPTPQHSRGLQTAIRAKRTFPVQNTNLALGEPKPQKPVTGGSKALSASQPLSQLA